MVARVRAKWRPTDELKFKIFYGSEKATGGDVHLTTMRTLGQGVVEGVEHENLSAVRTRHAAGARRCSHGRSNGIASTERDHAFAETVARSSNRHHGAAMSDDGA